MSETLLLVIITFCSNNINCVDSYIACTYTKGKEKNYPSYKYALEDCFKDAATKGK